MSFAPLSRVILVAAALMIITGGLKVASAFIVPLLLAFFIAIILRPIIDKLSQYHISKAVSITLMMVLVVLVWAGIISVLGASVQQFINESTNYQVRLQKLLMHTFELFNQWGIELSYASIQSHIDPSAIFSYARDMLNALSNVLTNTFMIFLFVIFILAENTSLHRRLQMAFPDKAERFDQLSAIYEKINQYMAIKAVISFITGFLVTLGLLIIGVDYAILWGFVAFAFNFIPTLGSLIAAVPAVVVALVQLGPIEALLTAALYLLINIVAGNIIEPKVMGKGLGISSLVVILSLVFWGWIFGPIGMLLSVPLTVVIKIILEANTSTRWVGVLLSNDK